MSNPILNLVQGKIRGSTSTTVDGEKFYKFQGIPYAKPPIGNLRFKAPVPLDTWDGILDATKEGSCCYNRDLFDNNVTEGSEDCLYLNVFTKEINSSALKPVLFWIHGGGFVFGSGSSKVYSPDFLLQEDVVVVTFNYRLGLFGFMSFEDPALEIPGNAGFKDMILALKWVQQNIANFGGDPKNVTIFGESAGGSAVHLLVLSPMSKGLFHRAIAQSGVAINPFGKGFSPVSKLLAPNLGVSKDLDILKELSKKSTEEIFILSAKLHMEVRQKDNNLVGYVIEEKSPESFLIEDPVQSMLTGNYNHVPFIFGYNSVEGAIFDLVGLDLQENVPNLLGYGNNPEAKKASEKMKKFYQGGDPNLQRLNLVSDKVFLFGIFLSARQHAKTSTQPVYMYRMCVDTKLNFLKAIMKFPDIPGAFHSDDLGYLFKNYLTPEINPGSTEDIARRRFVRLWSNFAKSGDPNIGNQDNLLNIKWKPYEKNILNIDESLSLFSDDFPEAERIAFWDELLKESPLGHKLRQ